MSQPEEQPLSQVVPLLVAALVCDVAVADPNTGKKNLIGVFDRVNARTFPIEQSFSVYFKFTDAEGRYVFDVRYVQVKTNQLLAEVKEQIIVSDRRASSAIHMVPVPLPVPEEGRYEFQIWANDKFLGSTFFDAVQIREDPE